MPTPGRDAGRRHRYTPGASSRHVASILAKLRRPPSESDHRRVLAVLTYLQEEGA